MSYPFPTRTLSSTLQDHLDDHNTIADILERTPFTISSTRDEHLGEHNALHPVFALPIRALGDPATSHLSDHGTLHANLISTYAGVRDGPAGQRANSLVPGFPVSFTSSHSIFSTLQTAVNAAGTARKFHITSSMAFSAVLAPHQDDEFWFDDGVTITRSGAISSAFAASVSGVKIMNGAFQGFNAGTGTGNGNNTDFTINSSGAAWEVAYCDFVSTYVAIGFNGNGATGGSVAHHNLFNGTGATISNFRGRDHTYRDNEFANVGDSSSFGGQKMVGTRRITFQHNYFHGSARGGIWFDTSNSESLVEWNIFEGTGTAVGSTTGTVAYEICRWIDGTAVGNDNATLMDATTKNVVRYNRFTANKAAGVSVQHSSWTEIYGNTFDNDGVNDSNVGSFTLQLDGNIISVLQGFTFHFTSMNDNYFHNNAVKQTQAGKKVVTIALSNVADTSVYYTTNTKNNNCDYNSYDLIDSAMAAFSWNGNKTFTTWQTVTQGPTGTGATQDIHGWES